MGFDVPRHEEIQRNAAGRPMKFFYARTWSQEYLCLDVHRDLPVRDRIESFIFAISLWTSNKFNVRATSSASCIDVRRLRYNQAQSTTHSASIHDVLSNECRNVV